MADSLRFYFHDLIFWLTVTADFLLVISIIFVIFYGLALLASSASFFRGKFRPSAGWLPSALILSAAALFTPLGEIVIRTIGNGMESVYINFDGERLQPGIALLWAFGFIANLVALVLRCRAIGRRLAANQAAPADPAFDEAMLATGLRNVNLKQVEGGYSPFSWSLSQGWVGTPRHFRQNFSQAERYAVYLHELTHIRNRDTLKYLMAGLLKAVFWFNPIVRHAALRYKNHLEIVCDHCVIEKHRLDPLAYSRLMARAISGGTSFAPGFSSGYADIARRFGYIFRDAGIIPVGKDRLTACACLMAAILGLGLLNPEMYGLSREHMVPAEEMETTAPDGRKGVLKMKFQWQGALGAYTAVEFEAIE
ncbi:hypothetical protein C4J81_12605 [Deltaproteobacteria bacterium Smac51]|nr:hypothetical protein C4J81_12605 [Deltaproteobacteria bacterium Smac51]